MDTFRICSLVLALTGLSLSQTFEPDSFFLMADGDKIISVNTDGTDRDYIVQNAEDINDLDYDYEEGYIYWTNQISKVIQRIHIEDKVVETYKSLDYPDGLAFDWVNRRIYWTDIDKRKIESMKIDKTDRRDVVYSGLYTPHRIVLDPDGNYLYWIDLGLQRTSPDGTFYREFVSIQRAKLNGWSKERLIQTDIEYPSAIDIDFIGQRLYWADSKRNTIESCMLTGGDRKIVLSDSTAHIFGVVIDNPGGLAVFRDQLYWTETTDKKLQYADKDNGDNHGSVTRSYIRPTVIHVYHPESQPGVSMCPSTWVSNDNHCYKFDSDNPQQLNFYDATDACHDAYGSAVVSINDEAENQFIIDTIQEKYNTWDYWWTSGFRVNMISPWIWKGDLTPVNYSDWSDTPPMADDGFQNFISLRKEEDGYKWYPTDNDHRFPYICELSLSGDVQNECTIDNGGCEGTCIYNGGSIACSCGPGYDVNADGKSCDDIDECAEDPFPCSDKCVNTPGSYQCNCTAGYRYDYNTLSCVDINECLNGEATCEQRCVNVQGAFRCECFWGFDIDLDGISCRDHNECESDPGLCDQRCINVRGSYACSCNPGHTLNPDGHSCTIVTCGDLPEIEDFQIKCADHVTAPHEYDDTCQLVCKTGTLVGKDLVRCQANGEWNVSNAVCNMGDNQPPSSIHLSSNTIVENSPAGTVVGFLRTVDADPHEKFVYTLNNYEDTFVVQEVPGVGSQLVLISDTINYETQSVLNVNITTTDDGIPPQSVNIIIDIYIVDVNEKPSTPKLSNKSIQENSITGTVIGQFESTDPDVGQTLTYSILNGDDMFEVSGENLLVKGTINYEITPSFDLIVAVYDNGYPPLTTDSVIKIEVVNVNEKPTGLTLTHSRIEEFVSGSGNIVNGTVISHLGALDPDQDDTHTFTVVDQGNRAFPSNYECFKVNGSTLLVGNTNCFDFEKQDTFRLRIEIADSEGLTYRTSKNIIVTNKNEPPTSILFSGNLLIENSPAEYLVGMLFAQDPDANDKHTFTLESQADKFKIVGNQLKTATANIDFESLPFGEIHVEVRATDEGGLSVAKNIVIAVLDKREHPILNVQIKPEFWCPTIQVPAPSSELLACVPESTANGTAIATAKFHDPDGNIDDITVYESSLLYHDGNIMLVRPLDYETDIPVIMVRVAVVDTTGLEDDVIIVLRVQNSNDAPESVLLSNTLLPTNAAVGTVVGVLTCVDQDLGDRFSYNIRDSDDNFHVEGNLLKVGQPLTQIEYTIHLVCYDGELYSPDDQSVYTIEQQTIEADDIIITLSNDMVNETAYSGAVVGQITASSRSLPTAELTMSLEYVFQQPFRLANNPLPNTANLLVSGPLDYERQSWYNIVIKVDSDMGTAFKNFTIKITNVVEKPSRIIFDCAGCVEGPADRLIGMLSLMEPEPLTGYIFETTSQEFNIIHVTSSSAKVTSKVSFDYETKNEYTLQVSTRPMSDRTMMLQQNFTLFIMNKNEAPTSIILSDNKVEENVTAQKAIGIIQVSDPDSSKTPQDFTCDILSSALDWFTTIKDQMGSHLLMVSANSVINYEDPRLVDTDHKVEILLRCKDQGGLSVTQRFDIEVLDVPEAPTGVECDEGKLEIAENMDPGSGICFLKAIDDDVDDTHTYRMKSSMLGSPFAVVGNHLVTHISLSYESQSSYDITITVSDKDGNKYDANLTIHIIDVNEKPGQPNLLYSRGIPERAPEETMIGELSTRDPDAGQSHHFMIISQVPFGIFRIAQVNQLLVRNATGLSYSQHKTVSVTVQVTDNGSPPLSSVAALVINVIDINDPPTSIHLETNLTGVAEDCEDGTPIGRIIVTDPDTTPQSHTCSLIDDANGRFQIRRISNRLDSFNELITGDCSKIDYETADSLTVVVNCSDNGGLHLKSKLTIRILDANDPPSYLRFYTPENSNKRGAQMRSLNVTSTVLTVDETSGITETPIVYVEVVDDDVVQGHSCQFITEQEFTFIVTAGPRRKRESPLEPAPPFKFIGLLDKPSTLGIVPTVVLDYKNGPNVYKLYVKCSDFIIPSQFAVGVLQLNIRDVPQPPTSVSLSVSSVQENLPIGSVIGSFAINDHDDVNNPYIISMVNKNTPFEIANQTLVLKNHLDFETNPTIQFTINVTEVWVISATDVWEGTMTQQLSITVIDMPEPPCCLTVDGFVETNLYKETQVGAYVGNLSVEDPDEDDEHTYTLVPHSSGDFTGLNYFRLDRDSVVLQKSLNTVQENTIMSLTVLVTDSSSFTITQNVYFRIVAFQSKCGDDICHSQAYCDGTDVSRPKCRCFPGYNGDGVNRCTQTLHCTPGKCLNGATCEELNGGYSCVCMPNYAGAHCEESLSVCADVKCPYNGECVPSINDVLGYTCYCYEPYTKNCAGCMEGYRGSSCRKCNSTVENCVQPAPTDKPQIGAVGTDTTSTGAGNLGWIIGGVIAILFLIVLILVLIVAMRWVRRKKEEDQYNRRIQFNSADGSIIVQDPEQFDNPLYDSVSVRYNGQRQPIDGYQGAVANNNIAEKPPIDILFPAHAAAVNYSTPAPKYTQSEGQGCTEGQDHAEGHGQEEGEDQNDRQTSEVMREISEIHMALDKRPSVMSTGSGEYEPVFPTGPSGKVHSGIAKKTPAKRLDSTSSQNALIQDNHYDTHC